MTKGLHYQRPVAGGWRKAGYIPTRRGRGLPTPFHAFWLGREAHQNEKCSGPRKHPYLCQIWMMWTFAGPGAIGSKHLEWLQNVHLTLGETDQYKAEMCLINKIVDNFHNIDFCHAHGVEGNWGQKFIQVFDTHFVIPCSTSLSSSSSATNKQSWLSLALC